MLYKDDDRAWKIGEFASYHHQCTHFLESSQKNRENYIFSSCGRILIDSENSRARGFSLSMKTDQLFIAQSPRCVGKSLNMRNHLSNVVVRHMFNNILSIHYDLRGICALFLITFIWFISICNCSHE